MLWLETFRRNSACLNRRCTFRMSSLPSASGRSTWADFVASWVASCSSCRAWTTRSKRPGRRSASSRTCQPVSQNVDTKGVKMIQNVYHMNHWQFNKIPWNSWAKRRLPRTSVNQETFLTGLTFLQRDCRSRPLVYWWPQSQRPDVQIRESPDHPCRSTAGSKLTLPVEWSVLPKMEMKMEYDGIGAIAATHVAVHASWLPPPSLKGSLERARRASIWVNIWHGCEAWHIP